MRPSFKKAIDRWIGRAMALIDGSALLLILPALVWMWHRDPPTVKSVLEWTVYYAVFAGLAVIISRITFPELKFHEFIEKALYGSVAAAIVVASVLMFVAWSVQSISTWARPIGTLTGS